MEALKQTDLDGARRFWLRTLCGVVILSMGLAGALLSWRGTGAASLPAPGSRFWILVLGTMGGFAVVPCAALVGVWVQRRVGVWVVESLVLCFTLAGVGVTEWLARTHLVQSNLWVAVESRLHSSDWAMREPALLLYDNLNPPDPRTASPGISVFGSSQSAVNFDRDEMAKRLERPVFRRALNGMFALETCAAQYLLGVPRTQTALFYVSPVDIAGNTSVSADWMRSLISPHSWEDVVRVLGPDLTWQNRRPLAELALAAHLRLWSFRDGARWILFNLAGRTPSHEWTAKENKAAPAAVQTLTVLPAYVEASFRGYELVLTNLKRWGFDILVFQGEVNPAFRQGIPDEYWTPMEDRIQSFFKAQQVRYVPLEEYRPGIGPHDWSDNMHMNEQGRRKLTEAAISVLASDSRR